MLSYSRSTLIGFISLFIWSFSALFANIMINLPLFELLSVVFCVSSISIFLKIAIKHDWHKLKQPIALYFIGTIGIYGNDVFYFEAFKHAPTSQVDLINYLWPIFFVLLSILVSNEKKKWNHIVGGMISFLGVFWLIKGDNDFIYKPEYLSGYLFALADAVIWACYMVAARRYKNTYSEGVAINCIICAVMSILAHISTETFIIPSSLQMLVMVGLGVFSQGFAYFWWERGIKKGDHILLVNCSYFIPITSIAILILFGKAPFTLSLIGASILVTLGAIIACAL